MLASKVLLASIFIYLYVLLEITLLFILEAIFVILNPALFFAWIVFSFLIFFVGLYLLMKYRSFSIYFSLVVTIASGAAFIYLVTIQEYNLIELVLGIIFLGVLISSLILIKVLNITQLPIKLLFLFTNIILGLIMLYYLRTKPFFITEVLLLVLLISSSISLSFSFQFKGPSFSIHHPFFKYIKLCIAGALIISGGILLFPVYQVKINPKSTPEIYFWTDCGSMPADPDILTYCAANDIGFVVVLREKYLVNDTSEYNKIQNLVDYSVNFYICLGGNDHFYATSDNADTFIDIYRTIKAWLLSKGFYYAPTFNGFLLDAEPPGDLLEDLGNNDALTKSQQLIDCIPSERTQQQIKNELLELIDMVHDDDQEIGLIKLPSNYDESDGDGDFSKLTKTFYYLDLPWDCSISMNYRTQHVPGIDDYILEDMSEYQYTDYQLEYLDESQLERNIITLQQFYYDIAYETHVSELNIEQENRYIFIGNFHRKFRHTTYIENEEYKKDLDICMHFNVQKVFLYEWSSFRSSYGEEEIHDLVKHIEEHEVWYLPISHLGINRAIVGTLMISYADKFIHT